MSTFQFLHEIVSKTIVFTLFKQKGNLNLAPPILIRKLVMEELKVYVPSCQFALHEFSAP